MVDRVDRVLIDLDNEGKITIRDNLSWMAESAREAFMRSIEIHNDRIEKGFFDVQDASLPDGIVGAVHKEEAAAEEPVEVTSAEPPAAVAPAVLDKAEGMYEAAGKLVMQIIRVIRRHVPTYDLAPAHYTGESKVMNLFKAAEKILKKNGGPAINARCYAFGDGEWFDNLTGQIESMMEDFYKDVTNEDKSVSRPTRFMIRLLDRQVPDESGKKVDAKTTVENFIINQLMTKFDLSKDLAKKIVDKHIRIIKVNVGHAEYLNNTVDLFTDISLMEYDRYRQKDYDEEAIPDSLLKNLVSLLMLSTTDLGHLRDLTRESLFSSLDNILNGLTILKIRAIDWSSLPEWKKRNDEFLQSL